MTAARSTASNVSTPSSGIRTGRPGGVAYPRKSQMETYGLTSPSRYAAGLSNRFEDEQLEMMDWISACPIANFAANSLEVIIRSEAKSPCRGIETLILM